MPFDPVLNRKRAVTEDDVEREFWRLVESITEMVEVEYGADIHSTTHGSGFPTIEKNPLDAYSTDPWNLNILPLHPDSLFNHIKTDISGMTVPWLYVGMCFSTFCWHNEDHYSYSANYQHFGATKTWYGIPGDDAERFEEAMKRAVPELFETQPDLLFQLVTLLPPDQLKKAGVNVFALDQRAGQFVITFPQAYHAGFNHGFNFNEAVNFAPHDWEPFGQAGVERLQAFRKQPCFSHDELLITAAARDTSIATAKWLAPALQRLLDRELKQRADLLRRHQTIDSHSCKLSDAMNDPNLGCGLVYQTNDQDETEYQCTYCKAYSYLSHFRCQSSSKITCLLHAGSYDCCEANEEQRLINARHTLIYRFADDALRALVQKVIDRAALPEAWQDKLDKALEEEAKPSLKTLRSLVSEGERIPYDLPGLPDLKAFVVRCNEWVDEAINYITRKQQNRRKNERAWRKGNSAKVAELEERDREFRKVENIHKLLAAAEEISFDCPEIKNLKERAEAIAEFQRDAKTALMNPSLHSTLEFEALAEMGKGFNVDIPEIGRLETLVLQLKWNDEACERKTQWQTLDDVAHFIKKGMEIGISGHNEHLLFYKEQQEQGQLWELKAKELISVESVHYQQLEALSNQATSLPVSRGTLAAVEAILTKQREAHRLIISMYERCKDPSFRRRPKYKDVREVLDGLSELNSKPAGTIDLEKEIKRHEDWMRKGKKLFGKANAPLHILQVHMNHVAEHNMYCFDLQDKPRMPVEPSSREHTPLDPQEIEEMRSARDVFCMCRQSEAGMMIECELCHEWYENPPPWFSIMTFVNALIGITANV
jgi:histone demethylase JARID1